MTHEEIVNKVTPIVAKYLDEPKDNIDLNTDMRETYGADSLDIVQIVMDVEHAFSITITDAAADGIKTAQDIINEVERNILD